MVTLREGESFEGLLKRFRTSVQLSGVLKEAKRRRHFVSNREKAREAERRAARRSRRDRS
ncbi:MAG: 30S ribosomal protein S21 [Chloroflexi bacterium]|nr:30S ribosomal protein S21 [Chloroflexota bacterium]